MRMGLRVPEDASVIGHADYPIATQVSPRLTTVHMPHFQMGIAAVRTVLARAGVGMAMRDLPPRTHQPRAAPDRARFLGPATTRSWRSKLRGP